MSRNGAARVASASGFLTMGAVDDHLAHRDVGREDLPVAIQDHSAMRGNGKADRVLLSSERRVLLMLGDLQIDQARRKAGENNPDQARRR